MIPVAVGDGDGLHIDERYAEVLAVSEEQCSFGTGIEQQRVWAIARVGGQDEGQTQLRATQRAPRKLTGAGRHDVVERNVDDETVYLSQWRHRLAGSTSHPPQEARRSPCQLSRGRRSRWRLPSCPRLVLQRSSHAAMSRPP